MPGESESEGLVGHSADLDSDAQVKILTEKRLLILLEGKRDNAKDLKALDLSGIGIDELENGVLRTCKNLYRLKLTKNRLKKLPKRLFQDKGGGEKKKQHESRLTFLDLSSNLLVDKGIERMAKWKLSNLVTLNLSRNFIESFSSELLRTTPNLHALMLNDNKLRNIRFEHSLPFLNTLILSGNSIKSLRGSGFSNIPNLKKLSASKNKLMDFPFDELCESCSSIAEVRLSHNRIAKLEQGGQDLTVLSKFTVFDVGSNKIESIMDTTILQNCSSLLHLSMGNNPFSDSDLRKESKQEYAKQVQAHVLHEHHQLRTLDGKAWSSYGIDSASAESKGQKNRFHENKHHVAKPAKALKRGIEESNTFNLDVGNMAADPASPQPQAEPKDVSTATKHARTESVKTASSTGILLAETHSQDVSCTDRSRTKKTAKLPWTIKKIDAW